VAWLVVASALLGACHDPEPLAGRGRAIVGGETDPGDPAVVAIVGEGQAYCTGTLISPRLVVTAAHCLDPSFAGGRVITDAEVVFGTDVDANGARHRIAEAIGHPSWDSVSRKHDIAVLRLTEASPTPAARLSSTALVPETVGTAVRLVGYGFTRIRGMDGGIKRQARSQVLRYTETDFTVGGSPGQTCSGDSGGPAFMTQGDTELLVGVTSWGDASCTEFGVDTRIDAYLASFLQPHLDADRCAGDGRCEPSCQAKDPDCASKGVGERCATVFECASGLCLPASDDASLQFCTQPCLASQDCPDGMTCVETTQDELRVCAHPTPSPGATGWPCARGTDCAHGLCVSSGEGSICSEACAAKGTVACPSGYACAASPTENARYVCLPEPAPSGGCSVARGPSSRDSLFLYALFFLATTAWVVRPRGDLR
jgi:hypothetical protein